METATIDYYTRKEERKLSKELKALDKKAHKGEIPAVKAYKLSNKLRKQMENIWSKKNKARWHYN